MELDDDRTDPAPPHVGKVELNEDGYFQLVNDQGDDPITVKRPDETHYFDVRRDRRWSITLQFDDKEATGSTDPIVVTPDPQGVQRPHRVALLPTVKLHYCLNVTLTRLGSPNQDVDGEKEPGSKGEPGRRTRPRIRMGNGMLNERCFR